MPSQRERYQQALEAYRDEFREGIPQGAANLMRAPGRPLQMLVLLERTLANQMPVSGSEQHSLISKWLGPKQRKRRCSIFG